jgi:hypothetical protein
MNGKMQLDTTPYLQKGGYRQPLRKYFSLCAILGDTPLLIVFKKIFIVYHFET